MTDSYINILTSKSGEARKRRLNVELREKSKIGNWVNLYRTTVK